MPRTARRHALVPAALLAAALAVGIVGPTAAAPRPYPSPGGALDALPFYEGPRQCLPPQPGTVALRDLITATYGTQRVGMDRRCIGAPTSEHHEGRALDWMLDAANPAHRSVANDFLGWLLAPDAAGRPAANARRLGVMYVIWDRRTFKVYRPSDGWTPYTGASPHTDHIHISLSWLGADRETSWWTGQTEPVSGHWARLGGTASPLGPPTTAPRTTSSGVQRQDFVHGSITWSRTTRAREVHGSIAGVWTATGAERGPLGLPVTDELGAGRSSRYNHFQNGSVYWSLATGAHPVKGAIRSRWAAVGWEAGRLGLPLSAEEEAAGPGSLVQHYQGGAVYWSPTTPASEVVGAIRGRWMQLGQESSALGLPITGELAAGRARYNHFQRGSIYWSPETGAQDVRGAIRSHWLSRGGQSGALGLPTSGEVPVTGRSAAWGHFVGGTVGWSAAHGGHAVLGHSRDAWLALGGTSSALGMPVSDTEVGADGVARTAFEGATLKVSADGRVSLG